MAESPDVCAVASFAEKPDRPTAEAYLASGDYWWNSGMFVWRAQTLLDQLRILVPQTYQVVTDGRGTPEPARRALPDPGRISVDYAVMEPVSQGKAERPRARHPAADHLARRRRVPRPGRAHAP